jgi:hypothetical protein
LCLKKKKKDKKKKEEKKKKKKKKQTGYEEVSWIQLAEERVQWPL